MDVGNIYKSIKLGQQGVQTAKNSNLPPSHAGIAVKLNSGVRNSSQATRNTTITASQQTVSQSTKSPGKAPTSQSVGRPSGPSSSRARVQTAIGGRSKRLQD